MRTRHGRRGQAWRGGFAFALLVGALACNKGGSATTAATPTISTVTRTTDTFTGTVAVGGDDFHSFTIAATGGVDLTLTVAGPPSTVVMGISIGAPLNGKCVALAGASTNTPAGAAVQLSGVASPATLCVDVRDVGNQTAAVSYTVTVTHP